MVASAPIPFAHILHVELAPRRIDNPLPTLLNRLSPTTALPLIEQQGRDDLATTDEQLFGLIITGDRLAHDAIDRLHKRGYSDDEIDDGVQRQAERRGVEEMT